MLYALAFAALFLLARLNLHHPFVGDQAAALMGGKALAAGKRLYIDFWDNKMPGLFWFYRVAGGLFGFTEEGIHRCEWLWMLAFALTMGWWLRPYFEYPWMAALAPLATVGMYYAAAEPIDLTQVEILMALPLFICAWLAARLELRGGRLFVAFLLSGMAGGVVVTFKIILGGIAGACWVVAAAHAWFSRRMTLSDIVLRMAVPAALGLGLVVGVVLLYHWQQGSLNELLWTAFAYPRQALISAPPAPYLRLVQSLLQFFASYLAWGVLIALAITQWWQGERDVLTSMWLAWLFTAVVLILVQRFSWWSYHFLLLYTPAGLLGLRGAAFIPRLLRARGVLSKRFATLLIVALVFPPLALTAAPAAGKASLELDMIARQHGDAGYVRRMLNYPYSQIEGSVRFLAAKTARPGPIYVFGLPTYYYLSGREPALPILGWAWQYFLQSQWVYLPTQLERALPAYIYIDRDSDKIIALRGAGVGEYIHAAYLPFATDYNGTWYQIRPERWDARHGSASLPLSGS